MEAKTKDLWVFVETKEDGSAKNVGIELLAPGRDIANKQGGSLVALVVGCGVDSAVEECAAYGADKVVVVDGEEFKDYSTDAYAAALATLIEKYGPDSVLIGATPNGRDLGPRVSCRLNTGLTADCTGLDVDEATGCVCWTRPAFVGNLMAVIMCPDHRPQGHGPPRRVQEACRDGKEGGDHPGGLPLPRGRHPHQDPGDHPGGRR